MSPSSLAADNKYIIPARGEFRASSFRISGRREKSPALLGESNLGDIKKSGVSPALPSRAGV